MPSNLSIFKGHSKDATNSSEILYTLCGEKPLIKTFHDDFLSLFVEKNSDGTRNLRLKGNEIQFRIKKRIENNDMPTITKFAKKVPRLIKIDLSYNRIDDDGLQYLIDGLLSKANTLEYLDLIGCDLRRIAIQNLSKCWETLKLKVLRLTGNKLGAESGGDFFNLLTQNATLEELDIGDTDQNICSVPHFCGALRQDVGQNNTLKILDMSRIIPQSSYYQVQGDSIANHLGMMLKMNNALLELHIQKCALDGHSVEKLVRGLKENSTLQFLDLGFNQIGNHGAEILAKWFMTEPQLVGVNMAGNGISEVGAKALSFGLPYTKLRLLDLSKNKISDRGLKEILLTIKKTPQMRLFYIFGNDIGPLSIEILERHLMAEVYHQENIDFQLYRTPQGLHLAQYPTNEYKHRLYNQLTSQDVKELRIRRNVLPGVYCENHAKIKFVNYQRMHGTKCELNPAYEPPQLTEEELAKQCEEKERKAKTKKMKEKSSNISFLGHSSIGENEILERRTSEESKESKEQQQQVKLFDFGNDFPDDDFSMTEFTGSINDGINSSL